MSHSVRNILYNLIPVQWQSCCSSGVLPMLQKTNKPYELSRHVCGFPRPSSLSALQKRPEDINRRSADMWSFSVLLWELVTREVPFADLSHMEIGMKVSERSVYLPTGLLYTHPHLCICLHNFFYLTSAPFLRWLSKVFGQPFHQGFHLISVSS